MSIIQFRISLTKKIYREIEISGDASLYKLAEVINEVFDFNFDHAFGFYDNLKDTYKSKTAYELFADMGEPVHKSAKSVKKTKVAQAFAVDGQTFAYLFDYGDEWLFEVKRLGGDDRAASKSLWKCTKLAGEAPEQYPDPGED